ncbi:hypothetical protein Purlil1_13905 [Purpureocillium lilacinum]|uniref:Uncharacterized protein n=1 Tax=Purpureocillium lilacinum TaxID=33203 RepID=A0ABR0BCW4_PURLI|nr:hypothetical protein Purlil1_13905 [Purpureocillium lilacinum]
MSWKPACFTPLVLRDSHHSSCKPAGFTPHVLRASHHTSCKPAFFTPHGLGASHHTSPTPILLHTTCPASPQASHHTSCKPACKASCSTPRVMQAICFTPHVLRASPHTSWEPIWLHTTRLASHFTSHHLSCMLHTTQDTRLCDRQRDPEIAPVLVFAAQFPKLSASFIPLSSNHRVTTVLMACMRPEWELPYPAQTLYIRVDEQLTGGRHRPDFGFTTSATTARTVEARRDVRSSSAFYGGKTTSECIIACEPFGHFE